MIDVFHERRMRRPWNIPQSTPQGRIGFDVNINDVQPYSRTTYANDVKYSKFDAGTTSILNIGTPHVRHHIAGVTLRREKPNVNGVSVLRRPGVRS